MKTRYVKVKLGSKYGDMQLEYNDGAFWIIDFVPCPVEVTPAWDVDWIPAIIEALATVYRKSKKPLTTDE